MSGVAVVTGASRGVGSAVAAELARLGFDVAIGYYSRAAEGESVAADIRAAGRNAVALQVDVRSSESCADFVSAARDRLGRVRAVVSNATGFGADTPVLGPALDVPLAVYQEMFTARLGALLGLVDAAGADLDDGGRVVSIASTGTRLHVPGYAPIATSMAAVEAATRYLAVELGRRGVTVNVVSGGVIDTDALGDISGDPERLKAAVARRTPLGRVGQPDDLAALVGFVCSEHGRWVTGQVVVADGGHLLG
ncbi:SDR family oxidoreductase (plasmid) [Georgenia sp. TF02-10]|uniref:SDR family NAD(P)-dependent oxidoreductase n=1 Tax=Georgenia sp. TF02-10 TaxID=2917725 RepID=UPI001FA6C837|nr:SDR family oxidoreductase [Georgenia sp. TF02-10]UNX56609.1 SDR family oxidoreductase [Georgenia sp. TF02-10]